MFYVGVSSQFSLPAWFLIATLWDCTNQILPLGLSRPDLIDSALLRPGRLDKSLLCDMPGLSDRKEVRLFWLDEIAVPKS